jgi:hypothetical protein
MGSILDGLVLYPPYTNHKEKNINIFPKCKKQLAKMLSVVSVYYFEVADYG